MVFATGIFFIPFEKSKTLSKETIGHVGQNNTQIQN